VNQVTSYLQIFDAPLFNLRCAPLERLHGFHFCSGGVAHLRSLRKSTRESASLRRWSDKSPIPRQRSPVEETHLCKPQYSNLVKLIAYLAEICRQSRFVVRATTALEISRVEPAHVQITRIERIFCSIDRSNRPPPETIRQTIPIERFEQYTYPYQHTSVHRSTQGSLRIASCLPIVKLVRAAVDSGRKKL
jgi:hypothetical protein